MIKDRDLRNAVAVVSNKWDAGPATPGVGIRFQVSKRPIIEY